MSAHRESRTSGTRRNPRRRLSRLLPGLLLLPAAGVPASPPLHVEVFTTAARAVSESPVAADDVTAQIGEMEKQWVAALKQGDLAWVEALYLPDGLLLPPNAPPVEGQKAMRGVVAVVEIGSVGIGDAQEVAATVVGEARSLPGGHQVVVDDA